MVGCTRTATTQAVHLTVDYGLKPLEAIRSATLNAAELMGLKDNAGAVEKGRWADVIAAQGDPLANVKLLESV